MTKTKNLIVENRILLKEKKELETIIKQKQLECAELDDAISLRYRILDKLNKELDLHRDKKNSKTAYVETDNDEQQEDDWNVIHEDGELYVSG